jgi:hypothetical protein
MSILKDKQLEGLYVLTASANLNEVTFTRGNGDEFTVTVDTGSGGGNVTADNGLTKTADNIQLGGQLVTTTDIDGQSNSFSLTNASSVTLGATDSNHLTQIYISSKQLDLYTPKIDTRAAYAGQVFTLQDETTGTGEWDNPSSGVLFKSTETGKKVANSPKTELTYFLPIPAGTFTKGNIARIRYRASKSVITNTTYIGLFISTTPDLTSATTLALASASPSERYAQLKRELVIASDTGLTSLLSPKIISFSDDVGAVEMGTINIDWNKDQYLFFTIRNFTSTDEAAGVFYYVEKL